MRRHIGRLFLLVVFVPSVCLGAPEIEAVYAKTPPNIDGKLDDACWEEAVPITEFTVLSTTRRSDLKTRGYLAYDDSCLYVAVNCLDPNPKDIRAAVSDDGEKVFKDDGVEIMIDPGRTRTQYYQFVVSAGGCTFEAARAGGGVYEDDDWEADWNAAASVNADGWSVELAIPYHALQITRDPGTTWGVNFCRNKAFPRELAATAEKGIYNKAQGFATARGINADFSKFQFDVGKTVGRFALRSGKPVATVSIPVTNRTGRTAHVRIEHQSANPWRHRTLYTEAITFRPGASIHLNLEPQRLQPIVIGQRDRYFVLDPPAAERIEISDASTDEILARVHATLPLMCTAVHVRVKQTVPGVILEVTHNLDESLLKGAALRVTVGLRNSRQPLLTWEKRWWIREKCDVVFKKALPPGAYLAGAAFVNKRDVVLAESIRPLTIQPPGAKVLNNFVTELLDAAEPDARDRSDFTFFNPRTGWTFVRSTAQPGEKVILLVLNNGPKNEALITHSAGGVSTLEAKRFLPVGEHTLQVHGGKLSRLVVRAIPEIIYPFGGRAKIPAFGTYDWEFMERIGVLRNVTTIRHGHDYGPKHPYTALPLVREWKKKGGRWLFHTGVPIPGKRWQKSLTAENAYEYWTDNFSFREPALDGHMADEINGGTAAMFKAWAEAVRWFSAEPRYRDKVFIPWVAPIYGSEGGRLFMNVLLGCGRHRYAFKRYLHDPPTLAKAQEYLHERLVEDVKGYTCGIEGGMAGMIVCFGIFSTPNETCNRNPGTNFKVLQDMEWNLVANHPIYKGVGGIQAYGGSYCDPETHRWVSKLLRHYCIEGRTEMCSNDPYELPHVRHPDYPDPARGWTVIEAEPGSTAVGCLPRYNFLIGTYGERAELDHFLRMKRFAKGPNSFSRPIKNLEPGRLYSLKIIVADYNDIANGVSRELKPTFDVQIDNVDLIADECFDSPFVNNYAHSWRKFNRRNRAHFIYVWRVFRAKGASAKLTVSDWKSPRTPGGPIGRELIFNFIQVQPFLEK